MKFGFSTNFELNNFSSSLRESKSFKGDLLLLKSSAPSRTNRITFALSICLRNLCPSPLFLCAPSINPGKSARVTCEVSLNLILPKWGNKVVKG